MSWDLGWTDRSSWAGFFFTYGAAHLLVDLCVQGEEREAGKITGLGWQFQRDINYVHGRLIFREKGDITKKCTNYR